MDGFPLPGMAHAELPGLTNGVSVLILCVPWVLMSQPCFAVLGKYFPILL